MVASCHSAQCVRSHIHQVCIGCQTRRSDGPGFAEATLTAQQVLPTEGRRAAAPHPHSGGSSAVSPSPMAQGSRPALYYSCMPAHFRRLVDGCRPAGASQGAGDDSSAIAMMQSDSQEIEDQCPCAPPWRPASSRRWTKCPRGSCLSVCNATQRNATQHRRMHCQTGRMSLESHSRQGGLDRWGLYSVACPHRTVDCEEEARR